MHYEVCAAQTKHSEGCSGMMALFEQLNTLQLRFNPLEYEAQVEDIFTLRLVVDVRDTVESLRRRVAERVGLAPSECVLKKRFMGEQVKDAAAVLPAQRRQPAHHPKGLAHPTHGRRGAQHPDSCKLVNVLLIS